MCVSLSSCALCGELFVCTLRGPLQSQEGRRQSSKIRMVETHFGLWSPKQPLTVRRPFYQQHFDNYV